MKKSFLDIVHRLDDFIIPKSYNLGHRLERYLIGTFFIWFGLLKIFGQKSATSIIAKSVYWMEPSLVVPALGYWEVAMGACLFFRPTLRYAIALFFLRLPGTFLALIYHAEECFAGSIFLPTTQGQYLIKELALVGAALIIASTVPSLKKA